MRHYKAHIATARVKDAKPENCISQLDQLRKVRMISTTILRAIGGVLALTKASVISETAFNGNAAGPIGQYLSWSI